MTGICQGCSQDRPLFPFICACYSTPQVSQLCVRCHSAAALEEEDAQRTISGVPA